MTTASRRGRASSSRSRNSNVSFTPAQCKRVLLAINSSFDLLEVRANHSSLAFARWTCESRLQVTSNISVLLWPSGTLGASMKITFVNHASFLLESAAGSIWCDPWTIGKVYNNLAALYSPSFKVPTEKVDYIWLSHEHSDHFHFPSLKAIPEADRRRITFLHQKHSSPRN